MANEEQKTSVELGLENSSPDAFDASTHAAECRCENVCYSEKETMHTRVGPKQLRVWIGQQHDGWITTLKPHDGLIPLWYVHPDVHERKVAWAKSERDPELRATLAQVLGKLDGEGIITTARRVVAERDAAVKRAEFAREIADRAEHDLAEANAKLAEANRLSCAWCGTNLDANGNEPGTYPLWKHTPTRCREVLFNGKRAELASLRAEVERLRGALEDCGTSQQNPDTCGVCHLHFADCDAERACFVGDDDRPIQPDFPACAGGRARAALSPQGNGTCDSA